MIACDELVGKPVVPGNEVPDDRADQPGEDHRRGDDRDVDHPRPHRLGDRGAEDRGGGEIEERGPDDGLTRREHAGRDDRGDRVGGVVKAVDVVEDERDDDDERDECECGVHACVIRA